MTGRLDLDTEAKKFWPKMLRAKTEGLGPEVYGGGSDGAAVASAAVAPPETVTLTETSYDPEDKLWTGRVAGGVPSYTVSWGDGGNTSLVLVDGPITHVYADAPGDFTVGVTDADGASATLPITLT